jgi:hypothetical protein
MCGCTEPSGEGAPGARAALAAVPPVIEPTVPLATSVPIGEDEGSGGDQPPISPFPPIPPLRPCRNVLREGCYAISFRPTGNFFRFQGTLRVDRTAPDGGPDNIIVSGDLYRRRLFPFPLPNPLPPITPAAPASVAAAASSPDAGPVDATPTIPIFARSAYSSYLKVTSVSSPPFVLRPRPCTVKLTLEQFDYTHPAAGTFQGSFPVTPSRTVTLDLTQGPASPAGGPTFSGQWLVNGVDQGPVTLTWVSPFFRRATVEIDTLKGAVAPQPVGGEFFDTIYAKHGWQLTVVNDQVDVPVPAGVNPANCWSAGNLHNLMTAHHHPATNLDSEWRIHLIVVPAKLGCSRGVMYDQIDVPREGCASFSDDGYPSADSSNFGTAANQMQRNVPRAYLRSATHEITHTFNQIHQEQETTADNSIMTTTPSVADVLASPGVPGIFPDDINLAVNTTVRHHLNHMPDPVIRPGGWPFFTWFTTMVPQAGDRYDFPASEVDLSVTGPGKAVALGEPFQVSWTMTNNTGGPLVVPNDVSLEGQFASVTITDADGTAHDYRPFVLVCDAVKLAELEAGGSVSSGHRLFWSSDGFAFPRPGRYRVDVAVTWSAHGVPVRVAGSTDVYVDYPATASDNAAAGLMLDTEVGKWVALGGEAYHLTEATSRLAQLTATGTDFDAEPPRVLDGLAGLLPDPDRM